VRETLHLARFASRTRYDDLSPELVAKAKIYVLDNITAGVVGAVQPWARAVADLARALGGTEDASVFASPWKTDASRAAWVNGTMIGSFELEHIGYSSHPSGTVFPAALAVAERDHRDGRALLAAMMVGYEVVCRIGQAQTPAVERERGFHNPAVNGPFGAAAAVGRLLDMDELGLAWALGIAGSSAGGLAEFMWDGAMTKRLHLGRASQLGLESALLAQRGLTGPSTVLEGRCGFFAAFSPRPALDGLLADLGRRWLAENLVIKMYPCHITSQPIVHAIQSFKRGRAIDPATVRRVTITADPRSLEDRYWNREPTTILGAQYSVPYAAAVALARDVMNPTAFSAEVLDDPVIRMCAKRISAVPQGSRGESDADVRGAVTIEMAGATETVPAHDFPGSPSRPLDFPGVVDKFTRYAAPLIGASRAAKIVEVVRDLDRLPDVGALAALIGAAR
jgi:2-methylcitrate dehydratase PrpD